MSIPSPITITTKALDKIITLRREQDVPESYNLRVGVSGGGCSGYEYILGFDEATEFDKFFTVDEMVILVDKTHAMHILGLEIDWIEEQDRTGFIFNRDISLPTP